MGGVLQTVMEYSKKIGKAAHALQKIGFDMAFT